MDLDIKSLTLAVKSISEEKNLPEELVKSIIEQALAAAYKKDYADREQEVVADLDIDNGDFEVYIRKEVVDKVEDEKFEISLEDAKKVNKTAEVGSSVDLPQKYETFGRVAAQTAKQVVMQRLREAEKEIIMQEYQDKIGTVVNGIVSRVEGRLVRVDLGKAQGIMPPGDQVQGERYHPGQRVKVYIKDIERGFRGPQLILSRGCSEFVWWLFNNEVPEMESGAVEIKKIAREAGVRSKIAVTSSVQGVDPVGTFVGGHGTRVNAVMSEIGEQEKIDIVVWSDDPKEFITNALNPTKLDDVILDKNSKKAKVVVPTDQLSIAIGRNGQNVRLASKLTGYELDIAAEGGRPDNDRPAAPKTESNEKQNRASGQKPKLKNKEQLESSLLDAIDKHGD
jgi:transcription termination/antitermination protein NusA